VRNQVCFLINLPVLTCLSGVEQNQIKKPSDAHLKICYFVDKYSRFIVTREMLLFISFFVFRQKESGRGVGNKKKTSLRSKTVLLGFLFCNE